MAINASQRSPGPGSSVFVEVYMNIHSNYRVRIYKGESSEYEVDKGLREGCPSSPPLFNVYHHAVMEDFRCRRRANAEELGMTPGISWTLKINGQCDHGPLNRY